MADSWSVLARNIVISTNKILIAIFNGSGSGKILKVYRIGLRNCQTQALTGTQNIIQIKRITSSSIIVGTSAVLAPHWYSDLNNSIPNQITFMVSPSVTESHVFRSIPWVNEEAAINVSQHQSFECQNNFMWIFNQSEANNILEPLICREGFGICLKNITTMAITPFIDIVVEFTLE